MTEYGSKWRVWIKSSRGFDVRYQAPTGATDAFFAYDYIDVGRYNSANEAWGAAKWISDMTGLGCFL